MSKPKFTTGDVVELFTEGRTFKLHKHPMDAHNLMTDLDNPKLQMSDFDGDGAPDPTVSEMYLVLDHRDLFTRSGYRKRYCKITGMRNNISGWISCDSLSLLASSAPTEEKST